MNSKILILAAAAAVLVSGAAQASTLTLIPSDPLASSTSVLGINNNGWMTGSVIQGGQTLGFIRDAGGAYTTFSVDALTYGRGIDNSNNVYGYATTASGAFATDTEYARAPNGTVTVLQNPNTSTPLRGIAEGANNNGVIVGDYITTGLAPSNGYTLDGTTLTTINVPGSGRTAARAVTHDGTVAGWDFNAGGHQEGFIDVGGVFTLYQDPNAAAGNLGTIFENMNNNGMIAGMWVDASNDDHAFLFNSLTNVYTEINVPGGFTDVEAFGLNDHNQVVLHASNSDISRNYIFSADGVPEPATWAMMLTGFFGLGSMLRRRRAALAV